jgi:micrococcal nuclease
LSRNQWILVPVLGLAVVLSLGCLCGALLGYLVSGALVETRAPAEASPAPTRLHADTPVGLLSATPKQAHTPTPEPALTYAATSLPSLTSTPTTAPTPTPTVKPTDSPAPLLRTPTPPLTDARVTQVFDGDTIEVEIAGQIYTLRYIGIECPEPGEYGCEQATQANRQLVESKTVRLEKDVSETDQNGRLLRYVYVGEIFVNAELVRSGYADAWTLPPDVAYSDLFVQLESEAREAGRGLWAAPTPTLGSAWNCSGNLYNCGDFSSCAQVMSYWNACPGDPSLLDGDHDGVPCEALCR